MPFFSVIVPVYNIERYLNECVDSILAQSFQDFELILVDDGSKDKSGAICDAYAEKNACVQVIHKTNGGAVSARKAGLQKSCGSYVVYIDSDDYIAPDYLAHYWNCIQEKKPEIIVDNFALVSAEGQFVEEVHQAISMGYYSGADLCNIRQTLLYDFLGTLYNFGSITWNIWSKAIKRELALETQMVVPDCIRMGDDCAVIAPAICKAESLCVTGYCGYYYRIVSSSLVRTFNPREAESMRMLIKHMCMMNLPIPEGNLVARLLLMLWDETIKAAQASDSANTFGKHMQDNYKDIISYVADGMKRCSMPTGLKIRMFLIRYKMWYAIWRKYHK